MNKFDVLIGQVVTSLWVDREEERIAIVTDKAVYLFATYAECCSETWFADILGYDALIGATIVAAELKDIEGVDQSRTRQEEDVAYGYTLVTSQGRVDLVFRNSSQFSLCK